tara:strand:- start:59 stop:292 length:234 start_codon:yes stop_codon:yes gene_type:complete
MYRLLIVLAVIVLILFILRSQKKNKSKFSSNFYKKIIIAVILFGVLFVLATSGRFLIPQILNIIKIALPFLTKFIGI